MVQQQKYFTQQTMRAKKSFINYFLLSCSNILWANLTFSFKGACNITRTDLPMSKDYYSLLSI